MTAVVGDIAVQVVARDRVSVRVDEVCAECGQTHSAAVTLSGEAVLALMEALGGAVMLAARMREGT